MDNARILPDLPFAEYLAVDALSPSGAAAILRSPAHYRERRDNPRPSTPAQLLGTTLHTLVLEPARANFLRAVEGDGRTKAVKEARAEQEAEAAETGATVLLPAVFDQAHAMAAAVRAHPRVPALLEGGTPEVSIFWSDPQTGAPCKGRPDLVRLEAGIVLDVKTSIDAGPAAFARAAINYGYHVQAAAYVAGLTQLGHRVNEYLVLAVEKEPPFAVALYRLSDETLELGTLRWNEALPIYADCASRNAWPAYSTEILDLPLPAWAAYELTERTELCF